MSLTGAGLPAVLTREIDGELHCSESLLLHMVSMPDHAPQGGSRGSVEDCTSTLAGQMQAGIMIIGMYMVLLTTISSHCLWSSICAVVHRVRSFEGPCCPPSDVFSHQLHASKPHIRCLSRHAGASTSTPVPKPSGASPARYGLIAVAPASLQQAELVTLLHSKLDIDTDYRPNTGCYVLGRGVPWRRKTWCGRMLALDKKKYKWLKGNAIAPRRSL